ncbi:hypothetical protein KC363_g246 [Hortaea werneckii]|nr:hypothetical protein KC363_g246 [Hortaea werneckii]
MYRLWGRAYAIPGSRHGRFEFPEAMLVRKMIPDETSCFAPEPKSIANTLVVSYLQMSLLRGEDFVFADHKVLREGVERRGRIVFLGCPSLGRLSSFHRAFDNNRGVFFQFGKELVWQTDAVCIFRGGRDDLNDRTQIGIAQLSKGQTFVGNAASAKLSKCACRRRESQTREAVSVECHLRPSQDPDDRYVSLLFRGAEALTSLELHVAACHHLDAVAAFAADTPRRNSIKRSSQGRDADIIQTGGGHIFFARVAHPILVSPMTLHVKNMYVPLIYHIPNANLQTNIYSVDDESLASPFTGLKRRGWVAAEIGSGQMHALFRICLTSE